MQFLFLLFLSALNFSVFLSLPSCTLPGHLEFHLDVSRVFLCTDFPAVLFHSLYKTYHNLLLSSLYQLLQSIEILPTFMYLYYPHLEYHYLLVGCFVGFFGGGSVPTSISGMSASSPLYLQIGDTLKPQRIQSCAIPQAPESSASLSPRHVSESSYTFFLCNF